MVAFTGKLVPNFPLTSSRVDALTSRCKYSNKLIENELGYTNLITIEDGITKLVQFYKSNVR
jgi:nucleoside-diphosphate-sugar epimerase